MAYPIVKAEGTVKRRPGSTLGPLDLAVRPGEVLAVVGPAGSGKTILLRMLWGFVRPDEGKISVLGRTPHLEQIDLRRRAGYVPTSPRFDRNLTAGGFFEFASNFYPTWNWEHARVLLESLGVDTSNRLEDLTTECRRKLAIASALTHRPELLILDEPTAGLGTSRGKDVLDGVRRFARERPAGVILSSSCFDNVAGMADSTVVLNSGRQAFGERPQPSLLRNSRKAGTKSTNTSVLRPTPPAK